MTSNPIFTIGHSTHPIEHFLRLLGLHQIEAVADVRSSPFSRMNPQYNRENLQDSLATAGIHYVFLGKELGARSEDPSCYLNDKVQYDRLAKTALFRAGVDRVVEGANNYRVALMCAEKEPMDCHRTILVARELNEMGMEIRHILADGACEKHAETLDRLVKWLGLPDEDFFASGDESRDLACSKQAERISYKRGA